MVYGVCMVFLAGKSPNIRSYTVIIYGSGQPYTCREMTYRHPSHAGTAAVPQQKIDAQQKIDRPGCYENSRGGYLRPKMVRFLHAPRAGGPNW